MAAKTATATAPKEIEILNFDLRAAEITVEGLTPFLTNRFTEKAVISIADGERLKAKPIRAPRDPDAIFKAASHMFPDKEPPVYGFPGSGFRKAMVNAGYRLSGEQMTRLRAVFFVNDNLLEIEGPPPTMHSTPACIPTSRTWTIAYRPMHWPWRVTIPISYIANAISLEQLVNLTRLAGISIGIGCWRPETGGSYGQFVVTGVVEKGAKK